MFKPVAKSNNIIKTANFFIVVNLKVRNIVTAFSCTQNSLLFIKIHYFFKFYIKLKIHLFSYKTI
ncbi:hypothetical protein C7N43_38895 [Sphingobacteriales bacterium UPWRP_1]|nr:hypothetical protein BVG80_00995 [Sphingobacteriales bacterium TSM_CSM]PSJ71518.1 hypothetical protein C7N43_38895 [Sphingobacteriales bacterium UPWRP_1]